MRLLIILANIFKPQKENEIVGETSLGSLLSAIFL